MMTVQAPQSEQQISSMFDRIAKRYDLLNRLLSARQDQRWRKLQVRAMPHVKSGEGKLLDVACGTGDVTLMALEQRSDYADFRGVDISNQMLAIAENKKSTQISKLLSRREASASSQPTSAPSCSFEQMSATNLKFDRNTFDALTISFGLRNVVDKVKALQEFNRVLRPGGRLLVLEFFIPERGLLAWLFQTYFHHVLPMIGGLISDRQAYKYLPESVGSFYGPEHFQRVLSDNGFVFRREHKFLFGACRLIVADKIA